MMTDPETGEPISHGGRLLDITKKRLQSMMATLDGSPESRVALISGLNAEEIEELGGVGNETVNEQ